MVAKKWMMTTIAIGAAGVTAYLYKGKQGEIIQKIKSPFITSQPEHTLPIKEARQPEPDDIENNKMLAEGSTFGVNYYYETKEKCFT